MKRLLSVCFALAGLLISTGSLAADWSDVWMESEAEELVAKGQLFKILLTPEEFGGTESAYNTIYVPAGVARQKQEITNMLVTASMSGNVEMVRYETERRGSSIVPAKITIRAWSSHRNHKGFDYVRTIKVW
ncbi:hypothetical protein GCM10027046_37510 [Uliginosibacterium flavum]|uniref:Uncharacterized protein n=1 Tax=Uliginosibacterium flavum TaxID=1396831 RepID=A0ABV2TM02_9RHOO